LTNNPCNDTEIYIAREQLRVLYDEMDTKFQQLKHIQTRITCLENHIYQLQHNQQQEKE